MRESFCDLYRLYRVFLVKFNMRLIKINKENHTNIRNKIIFDKVPIIINEKFLTQGIILLTTENQI